MAPPTTPQTTPPSRNFSYPAHQDATTLLPQHNQDNPPMAPNDSRLFLPRLPSAILSSRSANNLHSQFNFELERSSNTEDDSFYYHHNRAGTSHTLASRSVPDFNLTALPPPPLPPLPVQTQDHGHGLSPFNIQPPAQRNSSSPRLGRRRSHRRVRDGVTWDARSSASSPLGARGRRYLKLVRRMVFGTWRLMERSRCVRRLRLVIWRQR